MYTLSVDVTQLGTFASVYPGNLNGVLVLLSLVAQALQLCWDANVVVGEPLEVKLPFLTAPGLCSVFNMFQVLFSLCSCPPVEHTMSSVHSLRSAGP